MEHLHYLSSIQEAWGRIFVATIHNTHGAMDEMYDGRNSGVNSVFYLSLLKIDFFKRTYLSIYLLIYYFVIEVEIICISD